MGGKKHVNKDVKNNHFEAHQDKTLFPVRKEALTKCYEVCDTYAKAHGIKIYNATRGGKLEVFERVDFDDLMGMRKDRDEKQ